MAAVTSSVIFEPKKIKSVTVSIVSPFIYHEVKITTNLDSILKSRDVTLPTKVCPVKAIGEGNGTPLQYSTLAWKIPWMEEPGRLQSMGSLRVRHD